jgi:putative heme-binding domain-containing protein
MRDALRQIASAAVLLVVLFFRTGAQEGHGVSTAELEEGEKLFFSNCANCHGVNGDSIPGVRLASGSFRRASNDNELTKIIQNGIPGTPMPPSNYNDFQAAFIVAYLRTMAGAAPDTNLLRGSGDAERGKAIFESKGQCLNCHRVQGRGSFLGPDLSEIGSERRVASLESSLVTPDDDIRVDNRTVRIKKADGTSIVGRLLNQDTYRLQIIDSNGRLMSLEKSGLASFEIMKTSLMPSYAGKLTTQESADVVTYLAGLKVAK